MILSEVRLQGFRNFKDAVVHLDEKSVIFGENEVGKTNFLYALRLLFDKSLPPASLEPSDADFYAIEETNSLRIIAKFQDVREDCVISRFREHVGDNAELYVGYRAERDPNTQAKSFTFMAGKSLDELSDVESTRFYIRVLNLRFIGSNRDLGVFIHRERKDLIQDSKALRSDQEIEEDNELISGVEENLEQINDAVADLSYMAKSISQINDELRKLSVAKSDQEVVFDTGVADPTKYVEELNLATKVGDNPLAFGGDGRKNQIHLSLWAARNNAGRQSEDEPLEVVIFCIEEPEAHLHPHQQRKLASYLATVLSGQVIITTHSPQIVCQFPPHSLVRLYETSEGTLPACVINDTNLEKAFTEFGHRMSIIPAEAFFSNMVLLVEGNSELLLYKALCEVLEIDIDRLNISILNVHGIGFAPFVSLFNSLHIQVALRTDNDIFRVPNKEEFRFAGIQRSILLYRTFFEPIEVLDKVIGENERFTSNIVELPPPQNAQEGLGFIVDALESAGIFLAEADLEKDLITSPIGDEIKSHLNVDDEDEVLRRMQDRKATFMFDFLQSKQGVLAALDGHPIAEPLRYCQRAIQGS